VKEEGLTLDTVIGPSVGFAPVKGSGEKFVANHVSAEKRNRQRVKRTTRNRGIKSEFRSLVKTVREAISAGNTDAAKAALAPAVSALDSAVSKGVLHRTSASRKVGRLTAAVHKLVAPAKAS
jgi:small subunit ribosomal protein S20